MMHWAILNDANEVVRIVSASATENLWLQENEHAEVLESVQRISRDRMYDPVTSTWGDMRSSTVKQQDAMVDLRVKRDMLLQQSDWTHTADSPLSGVSKQAWKEYRKLLRELPSVYPEIDDIAAVIWPVMPG